MLMVPTTPGIYFLGPCKNALCRPEHRSKYSKDQALKVGQRSIEGERSLCARRSLTASCREPAAALCPKFWLAQALRV